MRNFIRIALISLTYSACTPYYIPNDLSMPLLHKKGETYVAISDSYGPSLNIAHAFSDHLSVFANTMYVNDSWRDANQKNNYEKLKLGEIAFGLFKSINEKRVQEIYFGFGLETNKAAYSESTADLNDVDTWYTGERKYIDYSMTYRRFFIQPNFGYKGKYFESGFGVRAVFLQVLSSEKAEPDDLIPKNTVFIEPALSLKVGKPWLRAYLSMGFSQCISHLEYKDYYMFVGSAGLCTRF